MEEVLNRMILTSEALGLKEKKRNETWVGRYFGSDVMMSVCAFRFLSTRGVESYWIVMPLTILIIFMGKVRRK